MTDVCVIVTMPNQTPRAPQHMSQATLDRLMAFAETRGITVQVLEGEDSVVEPEPVRPVFSPNTPRSLDRVIAGNAHDMRWHGLSCDRIDSLHALDASRNI